MIQYHASSKEDNGIVAGWGGYAKRSNDFLNIYKNPGTSGKDCTQGDGATKDTFCNFGLHILGKKS